MALQNQPTITCEGKCNSPTNKQSKAYLGPSRQLGANNVNITA